MNLAIAAILLLIAILFSKWSRWKEYYPTLLFIAVCNLLYNYLVMGNHLWKFKSAIVPHEVMDIVYTFIINPSMTIVFLSHHPAKWWRNILYWTAWTIVFTGIEYIQFVTDCINYFNGWTIWWTIVFYVTMYPMLYLHYRKPILALVLSVPLTFGYLWYFDYLPLGK
jgi:hypothetical protein